MHIKITKPFYDIPLWQFENVTIPDLDYSNYNADQVKNNNATLQADIYSKRKKNRCKILE